MRTETLRFPLKIKRGSVTVKIYRTAQADTRSGFVYQVAWSVGGRRFLLRRADLADARLEAVTKAEQLAAGKIDVAQQMTADDAGTFNQARRLCGKVPLLAALGEWARARELTQGNILPAAEAWRGRNAAKIERKRVADIVTDFLKSKTKAGFNVAEDHASVFESIRTGLGEQFIDSISAQKLDVWLAKIGHPVSRNTYRKRIVSVWRWARDHGYLPAEARTAAERTQRAREEAPEIGIISAATWAQFLSLIRGQHPDLLATAVTAGFCGLRRNEIHGQTWQDINLAERFLRVTTAKRGTPARRLVPLSDAAVEWLMLCPGEHKGPIGKGVSIDRTRKAARDATPKIDLPENCFRHAFISHRVAATGTVSETALEAGNSPAIVHRHYRELVTKAEGLAWFAVRPGKAGGVVGMDGKAVAS